MTKIKMIIFLPLIISLSACVTTQSKKKSVNLKNVSLSLSTNAVPLRVITTKTCLIEEIDGRNETPGILAVLGATFAQSAIKSGLTAINTHATKKATADTKGVTYSARSTTNAFSITSTVNNNGFIQISPSNLLGCITIIKESKTDLTVSDWAEKLAGVDEDGELQQSDIMELLNKNNINKVPEVFFQFRLSANGDGTYVVQPALLNYVQRLGVSKKSNDMDLSFNVEISELGKMDKPSLIFTFDFKELRPLQVYLRDSIEHGRNIVVPQMLPSNKIRVHMAKAKEFNDTLSKTRRQLEMIVSKQAVYCANKDYKKECVAMKKSQLDKNIELGFVTRDIKKFMEDTNNNSTIKGTLINIKASVTEVGDVNKFWEIVAYATAELKTPIEAHVSKKYTDFTDEYTTEEKITDSNNELNYLIAISNFTKAYNKFKNFDVADEGYIDAQVGCYTSLKTLRESAYKVNKVTIKTCD